MDPATGFISVLSLVVDFVNERRSGKAAARQDFEEWLAANRHDDVLRILRQDQTTLLSVKAFLHESNDAILRKLEDLDASLAQLASGFDDFKSIAAATHPGIELSRQALSIAKQCVEAGASGILALNAPAGLILVLTDGASGKSVQYAEPQFIRDDLSTLSALGLLRPESNSKGQLVYRITRAAAELVHSQAE